MAARVLLGNPDGVAPHSMAVRDLLGNLDGVAPDSNARSVSLGGGVLIPCTCRRSPLWCAGYLTTGWERRTFQLPRSDMSGSSGRISHSRMGEEDVSTSPVRYVRIL
uniref:Uncharacterized protein n=1 Tax=Vitis vinifera TaxID=29760 RepID=A5AFS0_VITVI|nr:hypothetical protein VITISV_028316 [Vitis vinifera]